MVFLKHFYAEGFKSFAQPISLNFDHNMIGIIGPNGSGKSNIVDALKWTIGEQSIKALRGKEKTNLIFMGSDTMPEAEFAMITLTFDNKNRVLHYDSDEVSVTRKLIRKSGESQFFINDEPARLKDIQDVFLDTGLSKGSLGIISQGTVNWFSEAKPEERRKMFEEAAGIGRYTKKKAESLAFLEKSTEHLERVEGVLYAKEKEVINLRKQAEKAQIYIQKKQELEKLDVTLMVQDLINWYAEIKDIEEDVTSIAKKLEHLARERNEKNDLYNVANEKFNDTDLKLSQLIDEKENLTKSISHLERKQELLNSNINASLSSNDLKTRIDSYAELIQQTMIAQKTYEEQIFTLQKDIRTLTDRYNENQVQKNELDKKSSVLNNEIVELTTALKYHEEQLKQKNASERGVKTIIDNINNLQGIVGTVSSLITVPSKYEVAIETALGKTVNNLVVLKQQNALSAIKFLKDNNAGRATFLPLDIIQPKSLKPESYSVVSQLNGYIGIASDLIKIDETYKTVASYLLGNIIIADNITNASTIANMTYQAYKVISLDGDVNFAGGAMQGGSARKNQVSVFNLEEKIETLKNHLNTKLEENSKLKVEIEKQAQLAREIQVSLEPKKHDLSLAQISLDSNNKNIERYKAEYESLTNTSYDNQTVVVDNESVYIELNKLKQQINNLESEITTCKENKTFYKTEQDKYKYDLDEINLNYDNLNSKFNAKNGKMLRMKADITKYEDAIVGTYKMTVEAAMEKFNEPLNIPHDVAKKQIAVLKAEIDALGSINLEAVDNLDRREEEYEVLKMQHEDAKKAVDEMKAVIDQLDKKAKSDFNRVVNKVNEIMPHIFNDLFGGGHCQISFTDPNNVLETGIEVNVQPPGKKVSELTLLSGGEKTLVALSVLFAILKSSSFPLVVLDEAEAALDQYNVDIFAKIIKDYSDNTQFLIITHRPGTMKTCDVLYGTTMQNKGVTRIIKTDLSEVKEKFKLDKSAPQQEKQEG